MVIGSSLVNYPLNSENIHELIEKDNSLKINAFAESIEKAIEKREYDVHNVIILENPEMEQTAMDIKNFIENEEASLQPVRVCRAK